MNIKLANRPDRIITAIEIGRQWLKIVQALRCRPENKVCFIDAVSIDSLSDEDISGRILTLSKKHKIISENLIVSIPQAMASTKNLDLPSTNPAEIEDMVALQIGKHTPYSGDEIVKGYRVSESHMSGYSRVMLVIVHRDIIQRCFKILEGAGISVERIGFGSEGFVAWGQSVCADTALINKATALIDIDYDAVDFEIVVNNNAVFNRSLSAGGSLSRGTSNDWQEKLTEEIVRSIYAYQNEVTDKDVEKIIVSAGPYYIQKLDKSLLSEKTGLVVEIIGQLDKAPKIDSVQSMYDRLSAKNISFTGLIGNALIFGRQAIDFVPQEVKIERGFRERGRNLYYIGIISVIVLILVSSIFLGRLYKKENYLKQLETRLSDSKDKAQALNAMINETALAKDRLSSKGLALDLIYEVHKAVPPEIYLSMITFDGKNNLILRGDSDIMSEVFNFVSKLEESEYFNNVKAKNTTQRKEKNKEIISFEIQCPLEGRYAGIKKHSL